MITRNINNIGQPFRNCNGELITNCVVSFTLVKGTRNRPTSTFDFITKERVLCIPALTKTNNNGEFSIDLWPTSRGLEQLKYYCVVEHEDINNVTQPLEENLSPIKYETWANL
jgi:hypothetical protein